MNGLTERWMDAYMDEYIARQLGRGMDVGVYLASPRGRHMRSSGSPRTPCTPLRSCRAGGCRGRAGSRTSHLGMEGLTVNTWPALASVCHNTQPCLLQRPIRPHNIKTRHLDSLLCNHSSPIKCFFFFLLCFWAASGLLCSLLQY